MFGVGMDGKMEGFWAFCGMSVILAGRNPGKKV